MNALATQKKETALEPQRTPMPERFLTPDVDIWETKDEYVLEADMPGVDKNGLDITLEGHVLTIAGHRNGQPVKGDPLYQESHPYDYRRVFELDPAIDSGKISAKVEHGVLLVTLPKAEKVKPRKITVGE
jgi:HSP20 family protein